MSDYKTIKINFPLSDFEEEQSFLVSNHANGWKLYSVKGKKYTFQKCDKDAFVYQIDFNPDEQQKEEYIQLYTDFDWQYVSEKDGRFYFSKSAICDEDTIFSDRETKAIMCRKIIKRKLIGFIPILAISILVVGLLMHFHNFIPLFITVTVAMIFIAILLITLCTKRYVYGLLKVKEMLGNQRLPR